MYKLVMESYEPLAAAHQPIALQACPVALLLALAARVCRLKQARQTDAADVATPG